MAICVHGSQAFVLSFTFFLFLNLVTVFAQVGSQPEQIHISYGDEPSQMIISWATQSHAGNQSIVEYGIGTLDRLAYGQAYRFVDGGPLHRTQFMHYVTLFGLKPGVTYRYHVGGEQGWSDLFFFTAMQDTVEWSPTFAVLGDMGNEHPQALTYLQREAQLGSITAVLHVGDFAYDMYEEDGKKGDAFMNQIQPVAAYVPYMTCTGNHEQKYNFSHYKNRFSFARGQKTMFSSFNIASAHIITINTEAYIAKEISNVTAVTQFHWLIKDLEQANAQRHIRPWIIVAGHRPMYCSNSDGLHEHCNNPSNPIRVGFDINTRAYSMEDLFYKYGVDLQFYAHEHSYERMWPVYKEKVCNGSSGAYMDPRAPVHVVTGSGGNREGQTKFNKVPYPWSAFRTDDFGYTRFTILNSTHLTLLQVSTTKGGKVIDKATIIRTSKGTPVFDCN